MTTNTRGARKSWQYLLSGFKLLPHPSLRWYVFGPLLINILIFIFLTGYLMGEFQQAINWIMGYVPAWLDFIRWIFWLLFGGIVLIVYGYTFAILATFIASPFYGLLSEQAEYLVSGEKRDEPLTFRLAWQIAKRSVWRELVKMGYFLPRIIGIFILSLALSFIPLVNFLGPLLTFLWGAWSLSLQYCDYAADNNQVSFPQLRQQASRQKATCFGFGGIVLLTTSIPVLNLFAIPASVVGGTALWVEQLRDNKDLQQ